LLIGQLTGSSVSTAALALSVVRRYLPSPILWLEAEKTNRNWLSRQRPLADRKTYFRSFIYGRSFANPESLVRIAVGRVDVAISNLTEIVNFFLKKGHK